ncbi:MAG: DUF3291 domain-containing protein [Bacteroidota bacterium]
MKITITSLELKSPFKFFALSRYALAITRQLKNTNCAAYKKQGIWTKHYTMTLWASDSELQDFARSGAHLESMKKSKSIAKEIVTLTIDGSALPTWEEAKTLLETKGKRLTFS